MAVKIEFCYYRGGPVRSPSRGRIPLRNQRRVLPVPAYRNRKRVKPEQVITVDNCLILKTRQRGKGEEPLRQILDTFTLEVVGRIEDIHPGSLEYLPHKTRYEATIPSGTLPLFNRADLHGKSLAEVLRKVKVIYFKRNRE